MTPEKASPLIKLLLDLGPLAVFFLAFSYGHALAQLSFIRSFLSPLLGEEALTGSSGPLFVATVFFLIFTLLSLVLSWVLLHHLPHMTLITAVVVLIFGGLTLWLHSETFIKMKPTIVNVTFASILIFGLLRGQSYLKFLMGEVMPLSDLGWIGFTKRWVGYFLFLACFNELIWRTQSTEFWITTKTFIIPLFTLTFVISQVAFLNRHTLKEPELQTEPVPNSGE